MKKTLVVFAVLLLVLCASSAVLAWDSTTLVAYGKTTTCELTPSWAADGSSFVYTYQLTNNTSGSEATGISSFVMSLPSVVEVTGITNITNSMDWQLSVLTSFNQLKWTQRNGQDLLPGATATFSFTSTFAPSDTKIINASCQDASGFGGSTYGPVPEPGCLIALATGMIGLVGLKLRRK